MKRPAEHTARVQDSDEFVRTPAAPRAGERLADPHVTAGDVLWTLTHNTSTAQARRWVTPSGLEFELLIWSGARVEGQEDLCWSQLFPSEDALAGAAVAKKQQLQASGWLEDIDTSAR